MRFSTPWVARWTVALGLAATLMVLPLGCAPDGGSHEELATPEGAELAKLDYTLKDMDGKDVRLSDFRGRPMVINFWATWCAPCRHEIPAFVELVEKYRDQQFIVLGISVDDSPEDLRTFAAEFKMNYPVLVGLGHDELQEHYGAYSLPVSWFVRADGTVDYKHTGTQTKEWFEERIKHLFEGAH
ncbi:MAG: TlpA disulfide reductase family protein [Acidobacteria bacterium]|nr:TlpA disulfide reductase family protein [Acidobacteriota bacterium]